jgi:FK506-binding protein 6
LGGKVFSFDTSKRNTEEFSDEELDFTSYDNAEKHFIPYDKPFDELKKNMLEVLPDVYKKVVREGKRDGEEIDFARHKITYHRNFYMENENYPFDSTYLNDKADTICNDADEKLEGLIDAISTMKEGEQSYFIVGWRKMFKETGMLPRVNPTADIFCDLKIVKIETIGDQDILKKLQDEDNSLQSVIELKKVISEARVRAKYLIGEKRFSEAIKIYDKVLKMMHGPKLMTQDEMNELKGLKVQVLTNLAVTFNRIEKYNKALATIRQIEEICIIDNQVKILFNKAKALRMIGNYDEAKVELLKAYNLSPTSRDIGNEMEKLDNDLQKQSVALKEFSQKLSKAFS